MQNAKAAAKKLQSEIHGRIAGKEASNAQEMELGASPIAVEEEGNQGRNNATR